MFPKLSICVLLSSISLIHAIDIYLHPSTSTVTQRSPEDASAALSQHLGVESFEPTVGVSYYMESAFVGQGLRHGLLLTMEDTDTKAILPTWMKPEYQISESVGSPSSLVATFMHRARHIYSSLFKHDSPLLRREDADGLISFLERTEEAGFAAVEFSNLAEIRRFLGPASKEYLQAVENVRGLLAIVLDNHLTHLAIVSFNPEVDVYTDIKHHLGPRQTQSPIPTISERPPPQEPIGSVSTCFKSVSACNNVTNTCSGRGQCFEATKAGRTCFVCTCQVTKTGEGNQVKTQRWVGQSCERQDISGPFVLLSGTVVAILLLIVGSISLLSSVGDEKLPSTLTATAVYSIKNAN